MHMYQLVPEMKSQLIIAYNIIAAVLACIYRDAYIWLSNYNVQYNYSHPGYKNKKHIRIASGAYYSTERNALFR